MKNLKMKAVLGLTAMISFAGFMGCQNVELTSEDLVARSTSTTSVSEEKTISVSFISANVAGLPGILSSSDPTTNTIKMGPYLSNFDVVSTQEDFAYHKQLTQNMTQPYMTESSGNVPFGDGMNIMSNYEIWETQRVKWDKTYGFITNGADQMTPKGFVYTAIKLADGHFIDVYDLHTDADIDEGSLAARDSNLRQLAAYINERSAGRAVIVIGDTNCRYTRDHVPEAILEPTGMKDAWVEMKRGGIAPNFGDETVGDWTRRNSGYNETVDKVFYRSGKNIELKLTRFDLLEDFVDENGEQLSDHYPVTANFEITLKDTYKTTDTIGGSGGNGFSFLSEMDETLPTKIALRGADRLDNVEFIYGDKSISVGGNGGNYVEMNLAEGEYITEMVASKARKNRFSSYRVSYVKFVTNLGNEIEAGRWGDSYNVYTAPEGYAIAGVQGMAGSEIDRIGAIFMKR